MPSAPIRTLIADDEKPAQARLLGLLDRRPGIEVVGTAFDGRQAIELINTLTPQLLLLDIQMPHVDGFGVLREVPASLRPVTIFVTAYDRYAVQAFEAHAADYLLKPFSDQRFESALAHATAAIRAPADHERQMLMESVLEERASVDERSGHLDRIVLRGNGRVTILNVSDVDWIEAAGVYLQLHAGGRTYLYRSSLQALLGRLAPTVFVRIHRSAVINVTRIAELRAKGHGDFTVVLRTGQLLTLSRAYRGPFERWLGQSL